MSDEHWVPPNIWHRKTCFVLGSGPSLTQSEVDRLEGQLVIAVNGSVRLAPFAKILFFNDTKWFEKNRPTVESFIGLAVTRSRLAAAALPHKVKRLLFEIRSDFPPKGCGVVRHGPSSGHKAVSLAIALGASRVVLLGFDMRQVSGRTHFHDDYRNDPSRYRDLFIPGFAGWHAAGRKVGAEIVNATPGSALREFPMTILDDEV